MRFLILICAFAGGFMSAGVAPLLAQDGLPSAVRSNAFVQVVATRGLECDLLKPWQSVALEAMVIEDMSRRPPEMTDQLQTEAERLGAETGCDSELLSVWIEGASRGFETEMLPPFLVAYKVLAEMETPPQVFSSSTLREDYTPAIAQIEAKLAQLEADGVMPEGGQTWPEYTARTTDFVMQFAEMQIDENADGPEMDQARNWLDLTGRIIELWLVDP